MGGPGPAGVGGAGKLKGQCSVLELYGARLVGVMSSACAEALACSLSGSGGPGCKRASRFGRTCGQPWHLRSTRP